MAADIAQVLRILQYRQIAVRIVDGRLVDRHQHGPLSPDMYPFIAHFRDQIVAHLREEERLEEAAATIATLTSEELDQYRAELAAAASDDPHIQHDRRAYRLAMARQTESEEAA